MPTKDLDTTYHVSDTTYHVSMRTPLRVRLGERSQAIYAFDGVLSFDGPSGFEGWAFRTDSVYFSRTEKKSRLAMHTQILVPWGNMAGMVPQPLESKRQ